MTRRLVDACIIQARAGDGRKESMCRASDNVRNLENIERWIQKQISAYKSQKKWAKAHGQYKRKRIAYVVRLYAKENES